MQSINFHLAYLLTKHECVIIPGFGAFVVSLEASKKGDEGVFTPPAYTLGFNPAIKHNDGLIANSLSKEKNISYKEATLLINQYVTHLLDRLNTTKTVTIDWLGSLSISSENKLIFTPAALLSCNAALFGFTNFYFSPLMEVRDQKKGNKDVMLIPINRKVLTRVGSVAAAILALLLVPISVNDSGGQMQNASLFPVSVNVVTAAVEEIADEKSADEVTVSADTLLSVPEAIPVPEIKQEACYYIIIASLPTQSVAKEKLSDFQAAGFTSAAIISKGDRYRIYVEKFEYKSDAEKYLIHFRQDNPKYATTWLLHQRG
jgi:nucleoid DNA-binding protein